MAILSVISTVITIAELACKGYKWIDNLQSVIDRAYANALKRWAPNKGVRTLFAYKQFSTVRELSKYLIDKDSVTGEIQSLLEYFEEELRQDNNTYLRIIEILQRENININRNIQSGVEKIVQEVSAGFSQVSLENQKTHKLLLSIFEKFESKQKVIIPETLYSNVEGYIARTARAYSSYDFYMYLEKDKYNPQPLSQYIVDGERLVILYSEAQLGKSTELKRLAFELYDSKLYNPFIFNLNLYNGKVLLEDFIHISERFSSNKIGVLILDGLDEVADGNRENLIIEIENIAQNYPNLYIVLSCRSNFEGTNNVAGFRKLYLNQLSWKDVEIYIESRCIHYDALIQEIHKKEYYEVVFSPFYLNESIKYFQEKGELPTNKTILYEEFINECFLVDNGRRPNKGKIISLKAKLYPILEHIAFCMLSSQRQEISIDELSLELGIEEGIIFQCLTTSLLYNDGQNNMKFLHNSFKEYIVAKYLSRLLFHQVQSIICYSGTNKIKPTMYNTSVLLLGVIDKDNALFEPLLNWLIDDYKELLVRCGFEVLEEQQRNQIFRDVFTDYKRKHLWIDYNFSKPFIQFANTKVVLQFLLKQIKEEDTFSTNMINALNMLKYAKFSLLQNEEFKRAKQLLLSVLQKYQNNVEYGSYLCRPFENECFLTSQVVSELFDKIKDTVNCNIINYFCTLICKIDQCDLYSEWVFLKSEHVHNYDDDQGVGHSVSQDYIIKFLKKLKVPQNIIKAIDYSSNIKENHHYWSDDNAYEALLFINLIKYSEKTDIINEVILNIRLIDQEKITLAYSQGYNSFIEARANADDIFEKNYLIAKRLLSELSKEKDKEKWCEFHQSLNIVVVLLNEVRLANILNDYTIDEQLNHWLCNHIMLYPAINGEFVMRINSRFEHLNMCRVDWKKRKQETFDILFERELLTNKVTEIIAGKDKIDTDSKREFFPENTNESVINFIWWCRESKQKHVDTSVVKKKLTDDVEYSCFLINKLPIPSHLRNDEQLNINNTQREKLKEIIIFALSNSQRFSNLDGLIRVVVEYNLSIPDHLLLTLFPYCHAHISYERKNGINNKFHGSCTFLDYLGDHISDTGLLDDQIENYIKSDIQRQDRFWQAITEHIVAYRKCHLYQYFKQLLCKESEYSYRLNTAVCITELGREGIGIVNDMIECLNKNDKIYYYEHILFPEDKSYINDVERDSICKTLENRYSTYINNMTEKILRILLNMGSAKALDWGLEYLKSNEDWAYKDHFPSLHKYNSDYLDKLSVYFDIATSLKITQLRMHSMIDATMYALRNIANESEESRDKIVNMFRQKAHVEGLFYLYRIADETYDKYFENNFGVMSLKQASNIYKKIVMIY